MVQFYWEGMSPNGGGGPISHSLLWCMPCPPRTARHFERGAADVLAPSIAFQPAHVDHNAYSQSLADAGQPARGVLSVGRQQHATWHAACHATCHAACHASALQTMPSPPPPRRRSGTHLAAVLMGAAHGTGSPKGEVAKQIDAAFGSFDKFKEEFGAAGATQFGSGWAWLVKTADGKVAVTKTPNAQTPLHNQGEVSSAGLHAGPAGRTVAAPACRHQS